MKTFVNSLCRKATAGVDKQQSTKKLDVFRNLNDFLCATCNFHENNQIKRIFCRESLQLEANENKKTKSAWAYSKKKATKLLELFKLFENFARSLKRPNGGVENFLGVFNFK